MFSDVETIYYRNDIPGKVVHCLLKEEKRLQLNKQIKHLLSSS